MMRTIFFTRLSFPHKLSPHTLCPKELWFSIQAGSLLFRTNIARSTVSPEACIEPVIKDLRRCGLIRDDDKILHKNARLIEFANVIFDLERETALPVVLDYLDEIGIHPIGRYGQWGYHWTDDAF